MLSGIPTPVPYENRPCNDSELCGGTSGWVRVFNLVEASTLWVKFAVRCLFAVVLLVVLFLWLSQRAL